MSFNIEGYQRNKYYLSGIIRDYKPVFVCLQEHWLPDYQTEIIQNEFSNYNFITTASNMFGNAEDKLLENGPVWHGTALGWLKVHDRFVSRLAIISDRFCGVKLYDRILVYSVYLPTSGQDDLFLETLSHLSYDIENNIEGTVKIIIGADTNESLKSSKRRINAMELFRIKYNMKSILVDDKPTFHHNNQTSESQIDHILFTETSDMNVELIKHLCKIDNSVNLSSHDALVAKVVVPAILDSETDVDYSHTYSPFIVKRPIWNQSHVALYQEQAINLLNEIRSFRDDPNFIPIFTELFSNALVISAEATFNTTQPKKVKKHGPQFSSRLKDAYAFHSEVCKQWRSAGRPKDPAHPAKQAKSVSQKTLQNIRREEEAIKSLDNHELLMSSQNENISNVCQKVRKIMGRKLGSSEISYIETLNGSYSGVNVLEGFCRNTEILCNDTEDHIDHEFYQMCVKDNMMIFEITKDGVTIPQMTLQNLKDIIFRKLKLNKAPDIYKLTVEHLRYAGDDVLTMLLDLLNSIIGNINNLSSPQLNTAVATIIHKGKNKPAHAHKSYRQVRVTPLIGRCLDEFIRPNIIELTKPIQNSSQYGFTSGITYSMAALQRNETEKFCVDHKRPFFGCSLDGASAFEVVNIDILLRELYCSGEEGQYWQASKYSYENSMTRIKMNQQLSRSIQEGLGVKQGHIKSSDNYKIYINPLLDAIDDAKLGVWIGPINVGSSACADDEYLMADTASKLQSQLDIAAFYGHTYMTEYGASKTKVTVIGSEPDARFYEDTSPWKLNGLKITVSTDNEHLGQIVSGQNQEQKNIDLRISKCRGSLFSMLGPAFAYKCLLSQTVKTHLFRTYLCPILRSGLSTFALRKRDLEPLAMFHRKLLRGILNFSKSSNVSALHFLLGELPMQGKIHRDMFSVFYCVWRNPQSKIHHIVKYLLQTSTENSRTWSINLRHISRQYGLPDPLDWLCQDPIPKSTFKEIILSKISAFHENELRRSASENSRMLYLNVSLTGLRGRLHPALAGIYTPLDVKKSRVHLKMLAGDYLTFEAKAKQSGGSSLCRCCQDKSIESLQHILTECQAYKDIRSRIMPEYEEACTQIEGIIEFQSFAMENSALCQFILDPSSLNLHRRVNVADKALPNLFKISRDLCYAVSSERIRILTHTEINNSD